MKESTYIAMINKLHQEIETVKADKNMIRQEIIQIRLSLNAFIRFVKSIFFLKWIIGHFERKEYREYTKQIEERKKAIAKIAKEVEEEKKRIPVVNNVKIGRNAKCPCGSGKKYKKCCLDKKEEKKIPKIDVRDENMDITVLGEKENKKVE